MADQPQHPREQNVRDELLLMEPDACRINVTFHGLDPHDTTALTHRLRNLYVDSAIPLRYWLRGLYLNNQEIGMGPHIVSPQSYPPSTPFHARPSSHDRKRATLGWKQPPRACVRLRF